MADLTYKFTGVNTAQLANEVQRLRRNSSTFQALEAAAAAAGYTTIEIEMGAGLLPGGIAKSTKTNSSTRTILINSDATGSWGVGGRQATVGEVIAHELAHAVVPSQYKRPATIDPQERDSEGMWVRRQAGQVALDLGLPGANNADYPITRIPVDKEQVCTWANPLAVTPQDGILFLDGSRGYNGKGSTIPPGSGSQDPVDSRRLATDEIGQEFTPAGSDGPFQLRRRDRVTLPPIQGPSDNPRAFDDRFGQWGSSPAAIAPPPALDRPESVNNRFGNWGSVPTGGVGDTRSPVLRALEKYKRSAVSDGPAAVAALPSPAASNAPGPGFGSQLTDALNTAGKRAVPVLTRVGKFTGDSLITPAEGASPLGPLLRDPTVPNLPGDETQGLFSDKPERRLSRRIVNPSASASQATPDDGASFSDRFGNRTSPPESIAPFNPNLAAAPPEPRRPLGIFSGKPMPVWTVPPPLGGLSNNSNTSTNWYTALGGNFLPPAGGANDRRDAREPQESQGPLSLNDAYLEYVARLNRNKPEASTFDPSAPTAPFDASDPSAFSGGLLGRYIALAGLDPENLNLPALPPLDDEQEQANLQALDAKLSSAGDIRDAVALYKAREASRR